MMNIRLSPQWNHFIFVQFFHYAAWFCVLSTAPYKRPIFPALIPFTYTYTNRNNAQILNWWKAGISWILAITGPYILLYQNLSTSTIGYSWNSFTINDLRFGLIQWISDSHFINVMCDILMKTQLFMIHYKFISVIDECALNLWVEP